MYLNESQIRQSYIIPVAIWVPDGTVLHSVSGICVVCGYSCNSRRDSDFLLSNQNTVPRQLSRQHDAVRLRHVAKYLF